jgi:hypothetical protein
MARYTLKSFLRQTQNALLLEYFTTLKLLPDFDWYVTDSSGNRSLLPETEINALAEAVEQIENNDLLTVTEEFKHICWMADANRIGCLIELGMKSRFSIDLAVEFVQNGIEGVFSRSMYVHLRHRELFDYAMKFMEIIDTENAREFEIGTGQRPKVDEKTLTTFKQQVIKHYTDKGHGDKCVIDCYHKKGETDQYCYYIFQEDCVRNVLDFDETGERIIWQPRRTNFDNVFFFEPKTGNLRIHAGGERNSEQLADLFCIHILGLDGRPTRDTMVFDLSKVINRTFTFDHQAPITSINLKEIVCDMGHDEEVILKAKGREEKGLLLQKRLHSVIKTYGIDESDVTVLKIKFQVVFQKQKGVKGRNTRTKVIHLPNQTNITADDFFDKAIKKHVEEQWNFRRTLLSKAAGAA